MKCYKLNSQIGKIAPKKRRGVAEVISTLLLVVVTVAGAVILTSFLDETFVAGGLSVTSSTDTTIKTIKLIAYDTRDGEDLMGFDVDNHLDLELCRQFCDGSPSVPNTTPSSGGSEFLMIQIENLSVNPIFLRNLFLDNVNHPFDPNTSGEALDTTGTSGVNFPADGRFSILKVSDGSPTIQDGNQIEGGQSANLLIKLHSDSYDNIDLSKTMRVQLNIGENSLAEFLIETGDAR